MEKHSSQADLASQSSDSEQALIDGAITRDVRAFGALYDRYLDRVYRHVYYRVGRRADAEDLTQQVFLQAWRAIGRYRRTEVPFIAWLLRIAHNLVVSFHQQAKVAEPLDAEPGAQQHWIDPEAEVLAKYDGLALRRVILRLRPEHQQVVVMRFIQDCAYADIAAALGKSEGNVRVIQHRALAELRRLLAHEVNV